MRINFLLPGHGEKSGGGLKVVYEYANGLARRGHHVTVIHPARLEIDAHILKRPEKLWRYLYRRITGGYRPGPWFAVDDRVDLRWAPSLRPRNIPPGDVAVATACATAEWLAGYPSSKGEPCYLIQGYETFAVSEERLLATWRLPFRKIAVSKWLQEVVERAGGSALYIPNGLDFQAFGIDVDIEQRSPYTMAMMCHEAESKGWPDGLAALQIVRSSIPNLRALVFGVEVPSGDLPDRLHFFKNPDQGPLRSIYNQASVFVGPSRIEGWGLPPAEAMACGCAVAATDNGGHREYAQHEITALLSPVKDPPGLAGNILRLMRDKELRLHIARAGNAYIRKFTWDKAVNALERAICF